eukprot:scaffold68611_cov53-Phaeocystis_antarctica.AAC.1
MHQMFWVHTARALSPAFSRALPVCMPLASPPPHVLSPHGPHLNPPTSNARLSTRQGANAFNQPLAFDTSKVTNMDQMFVVRSARALAPSLGRALAVHAACAAAALCPSRHPARTSPRIVRPPFDSAERGGLQPAAELQHVQRHEHVRRVLRALRACSAPQPSVGPSPCTPLALSLPPSRPAPRSASHAPSFRLGSSRRRSTSR